MSALPPRATLRLDTPDESATEALGAVLARTAPRDPMRAIGLHLQGDLGAGKTTLVRGFLRALGVEGAVRSPTYGLLEPYAVGGRSVLHLDLYRLADDAEVDALGLRDHDEPGAIWLIEWPERAGAGLPPPDLTVRLDADRPMHHLSLAAGTAVGAAWLSAAASAAEPPGASQATPEG